ncbi:MAG TPA: rhomboid family intramembrane serine protease [Terriglobia bacterium]|nr:rhomboid family intramembrane serine protease [Terriglobia bacterium]
MTGDEQPVLISGPELAPGPGPRRWWPVATLVILGVTILVFLLENAAGGSTNPDVLLELGAAYGPYIRRGEYWRLVMPMFLHAGLLHIALNSYALWVLGPLLERIYGYGRYTCLYVGAGVGASIVSAWRANSIAVGASGAIFGIACAMVVVGYQHPEVVPWRWHRLFGRRMITVILLSLAFGPALELVSRIFKINLPRIDNWAHLGGIATGALLALLIAPPRPWDEAEPGEAAPEAPSQAMVVIPIAIVILAFGFTARLYRVSSTVTRLLTEGARFEALHQNDAAVARWQQAAHLAPDDERPHDALGFWYLEQNRSSEAIEQYREALRSVPDSDEAQLGLAVAYQQSGDQAKARGLLDQVRQENPSDAESQEQLADLCAKFKLYADAIQRYQRAIVLAPTLAVAHNNLAWLYATAEDPQCRNPAQALEHAQRAVSLSRSRQPEYLDTLAEAWYVNQNYAEAVKVETQAMALAPNNDEYKDHMARYRKAAGA